jgi:cell division protein FtsZ
MIHFEIPKNQSSIIKVIGVGGGGCNAVNYMHSLGIEGVDFIVCNTDSQSLALSPIANKVQLGPHLTQGLGAGANPEIGKQACEESYDDIEKLLKVNTKMVFVTAGMGGGTGTGSAPVVARASKDVGALTIGIVTTPFFFEGKQRMNKALAGIEKLKENVDTIIVIPNENLLTLLDPKVTMSEAFEEVDTILLKGIASITDLITTPGFINVDFADVRRVMENAGTAFMGLGFGEGKNRADQAAESATTSPILDVNLKGAKGILLSIASASNITMAEVSTITSAVSDNAHEDANIIFGTVVDETLEDQIRVTVIATGFEKEDV